MKCKSAITFFSIVITFLITNNVIAELVSTKLSTQQRGHAWLFSSPHDATCWVAAPAHIFKDSNNEFQKPILTFQDGKTTQLSEIPIQPDPNIDLSFAAVPKSSGCFDTLGVNNLDKSIEPTDTVRLSILSSSINEGFPVRIRSLSTDENEIIVEPEHDKLKKGFSGGLISLPHANLGGDDLPIGILLRVCDINTAMSFDDFSSDQSQNICDNEHHYGYALRFDKIKQVFITKMKPKQQSNPTTTDSIGSNGQLKIELLSTSIEAENSISGPANSFFPSPSSPACWQTTSDTLGIISATIRVTGNPISSIQVFPCDKIDETTNIVGLGIKSQSISSKAWSSIRYCSSENDSVPMINCFFLPKSNTDTYLLQFKSKQKSALTSIGRVVIN